MVKILDMEQLQKIVYYVNNVKMSIAQREELHRFVIDGILVGEIDTSKLFLRGSKTMEPQTDTDTENFIHILRENCSPPQWVRAQELYDRYVKWCEDEGVEQVANATFAAALVAAGTKKKKRSDGNYYLV